MMAGYLAERIKKGVVTYKKVFVDTKIYAKYREETNMILELDGYGDLIVRD